jgi:hypothetical protein
MLLEASRFGKHVRRVRGGDGKRAALYVGVQAHGTEKYFLQIRFLFVSL